MRGRALCIVITIGAGVGLLGPSPASAAEAGQDCAACHEELVQRFADSPHGRVFALHPDHAAADCTSCHGPAAAHMESSDPAAILNPAKAADGGLCLSCHENEAARAWWAGSAHEAAGIGCAECHSVHAAPSGGAAADTRATTELCLSCHANFRKHLNQRSTHPLRDGQMDCTACHNPHGGSGEHLIDADSVNDLCFSCHEEKRGPFLWEHSPVREDCLTCHSPHGSNHPGLLVARTMQVCQACHLQGRHQTVAGTETAMWNLNRQCLNCHPAIHGSNHPSGPLFQR